MFNYFGYGSNINLLALKAKGVEAITSEKAILRGWKLKFNVQHFFKHEGGMGNIEPSTSGADFVEGMIHLCKDEHLAPLDATEAYGIGYDRINVEVETRSGFKEALTYIGMPDFINNNCRPTRRYLNIILKGAKAAELSPKYIEGLENSQLHVSKKYEKFKFPESPNATFNQKTLSSKLNLTALAGGVFDMANSRSQLQALINFFGGKDMTMFHLKRHDSSDGNETMEDYLNGRISPGAKDYINSYLHEYAKEYSFVGRMHYNL